MFENIRVLPLGSLSGDMVEHLVCCVVVDDLSGAQTCLRLMLYTNFHTRHSLPNVNFVHCVARVKFLWAVFNS